ncbi:MAG: prepilin-type N-terminal cleavage/methylation domain-containing protein [Candidatus Tectomicrobia bacterium]|nr:prepilin-type N-terminal cleavage/methylation domain-containing protein [Candidatus Tectomicrobia bacterium]
MNRLTRHSSFVTMSERGLTMVELMVALTISAILLTSIFALLMSQEKAYRLQEQIAAMDQNAHIAMELMRREISMTGYPRGGVVVAEGNRLSFQGDLDDNATVETIVYALDTTRKQLTRTEGGEEARPVSGEIIGLEFSYFDKANNLLGSSISAEQLSSIARVDVALTAQTERPDPRYKEYNGYRRVKLTGTVLLRNMVIATESGQGKSIGCSVPAAPSEIKVIRGLDPTLACKIHLEWTPVLTSKGGSALSGSCAVSEYRVYYGTTPGNYTSNVAVETATSYDLNTSSLPACSYFVAVSAVNVAGEGAKSPESSLMDESVPNSPSGLAATSGSTDVQLKWNASLQCDAKGYNVYRSISEGGPYKLIKTVFLRDLANMDNPAYVDRGTDLGGNLARCTPYYYRITTFDACFVPGITPAKGESVQSTPASIETGLSPPQTPINLSMTVSEGNAYLSWEGPTLNADGTPLDDLAGFHILKSDIAGGPYTQVNSTLITPSKLTSSSGRWNYPAGLPLDSFYVITAQDSCGNVSAQSIEVKASGACPSPPKVTIFAPTSPGQTVSEKYTFTGNASSDATVEIQVGSGPYQLITTRGVESWSYTLNTTTLPNGIYPIRVKATQGECTTVRETSIMIQNLTIDSTPPTMAMVKPTAGADMNGMTTITVNATDNTAVQRVIYWITGDTGVATGSEASPLEMTMNGGGNFSAIYNALTGTRPHTIHVIAIDTAGNRSAEATVDAK